MLRKVKRLSRISRQIRYKETWINHREQFWSYIGSFSGIGLIAFFQSRFHGTNNALLLTGSFGAQRIDLWHHPKPDSTAGEPGRRPHPVRPPGAATPLIALIGSEKIKALGYACILSPVLGGVLILFLVAMITNHATGVRSYPTSNRVTRLVKRHLLKSRQAYFRKPAGDPAFFSRGRTAAGLFTLNKSLRRQTVFRKPLWTSRWQPSIRSRM